MRFHVRDDVASAPVEGEPAVRIPAECDERVAHRHAGIVGLVEPRRIEGSCHRLAADERDAEAHAFLVAEADDFEGIRKLSLARNEILDARGRRQHAEEAVVLAGIAHAVDMRARHHDWRIGSIGGVASDDVAERVEARRHAGVAHQADQVFAGGLVLGAQVRARNAGRILGELREMVGLRHQRRSEAQRGFAHGASIIRLRRESRGNR